MKTYDLVTFGWFIVLAATWVGVYKLIFHIPVDANYVLNASILTAVNIVAFVIFARRLRHGKRSE